VGRCFSHRVVACFEWRGFRDQGHCRL